MTFQTTGDVQLSTDASDLAGRPARGRGRLAQSAPLPQALAGALIARIGNGRPFPIGDQTSVTMPAAGQLFLGINDDHLATIRVSFRVESCSAAEPAVSRARRRRRNEAGAPRAPAFFLVLRMTRYPWPTGKTRSTCPGPTSR